MSLMELIEKYNNEECNNKTIIMHLSIIKVSNVQRKTI